MPDRRAQLLERLEAHYRGSGWAVRRAGDGTLLATGPGGVTWIGAAILPEDLAAGDIEQRLLDLAGRRMPEGGELCPFELLPAEECAAELEDLLQRLHLAGRPNVSVYSLAA